MKYLFATGGTAGHINPALAVATLIRDNDKTAQIKFIGTADHMESRLVPNAGFEFDTIDINGFSRSLSLSGIKKNIATLLKLFKAEKKCKHLINEFDPDVVIGFGGYVSGPVLQQANKMGYKTCIHEQNAYPGITNKQLAKKVDRVMLTVEDAKKHLSCKNEPIVTGLPVRGEVLTMTRNNARKILGIPDDEILVLSFGGSLGAAPINDAMLNMLLKHSFDNSMYHIHSAGTNGVEYLNIFKENGFVEIEENTYKKGNVEVKLYIDNMDVCMSAADIVIGRAGASSLSEIESLGKASILIPSPYVAENHQYHNAMALVNRNAAKIIEEKDLTSDALESLVDELASNKNEIKSMEANARELAILDSRERITEIIVELANG